MQKNNPAFVLIHGAWHDHHTWDKVVPILAEKGFAAVALDLPGAGKNAKWPESYSAKPFDIEAFKTEPSPNNTTTQAERNTAVIDAIQQANALGNGQVVLVGHSLGGLTLNQVGELVKCQAA